MMDMAGFGHLHISTQGEDKWGVTQGGCWKGLRAAAPGYPLDKVKRSQQRPRAEARLVPERIGGPAYCMLRWRPRAVNGPEIFGDCGPVLVHAANGRGMQPREADSGIHCLRHWQSNAHQRARRGSPGSWKLDGPLQPCLGAAASHSVRMPPPITGEAREGLGLFS